jgi:nucleoside-diphosphate-sugar epimerase
MRETVCVTGGSGGIGQALLEQLIDLYEVKALFRTRTGMTDTWQRRGCTAVWGDLDDEEALGELVAGARFVFHCAAVVAGPSRQSHAVNVEGTRRLARAAARQGCQRFVHVGSAAVYSAAATEGDRDYTEDTPLSEHGGMAVYSLTKLRSENALSEVARESGLEFTILRPTCVYGPHTRSYTSIPLALIRKGVPVILGDGQGLLDAVYVDDVARAMLLAAPSPRANGEVFNIGHQPVTAERFYGHYARMLNRPARHVPLSLLSATMRLLDLVPGRQGMTLPEWRRGAALLLWAARNTRRFPSSKATAVLGYSPQVTLPTGMLQVELWARRQGLVDGTRHSLEGYGLLPFRPIALVRPESEEDIVRIVRTARRGDHRVKAIGSLHSLCPIPETDGICVVLDRYDKLLAADGRLVTVQAGMKLRDLNDALAALKLALPVNGSIAEQTVSGAISTATHGGSIHHGTLSDCVETVRIVRADGTARDIDRSQHVFPAVIVSLGLLGIVSTVTFRCVPSFALRSRISVRKAEEVLDGFDRIHRGSLYVDMLYYPITDDVEILTIDRTEEQPIHGSNGGERRAATAEPPGATGRAGLLVAKSGAWLLSRFRLNAVQRRLTSRAVGSYYRPRAGRSDHVLVFGDRGASRRSPMTIQDMEIAIPYEQAREAIGLLRDHFLTTRKYPLFPVHIRASARSDLWLSPSHERDVCWLELWQYPRHPAAFRQIHELMRRFHYRFHWGKEAPAGPEYIREEYARWDDFVRLRNEWDPTGMFSNGYLESFFTPPR